MINAKSAFEKLIAAVTAKRPRTVLDHILKHGYITTDDLKTRYGYNHPPRAARDVREQGIPLETFMVQGPDGRRMAAYRLGDPRAASAQKAGGRRALPKSVKDALLASEGEWCALCGSSFPGRALQVDHRVPYEVAGDVPTTDPNDFMLVCGSCNRAKSWSCEHCANWLVAKDPEVCRTCYWASPSSYRHIAGEQRRQLIVSWSGSDVAEYESLMEEGKATGLAAAILVKKAVRERTSDYNPSRSGSRDTGGEGPAAASKPRPK